jgi:8-oxo-dGTP pyrophosphatase MutT (NUDIX family)
MIIAAGVLVRAPSGKILLLKRSYEGDAAGQWAFPGGKQEDGETLETCAVRETLEETGYNVGAVDSVLMRRIKDGTDFTTYVKDVDDEFTPTLNGEHTAFVWINPKDVADLLPARSFLGQASGSVGP